MPRKRKNQQALDHGSGEKTVQMEAANLISKVGPIVFEHTPCIAAVIDRQRRVVLANDSFKTRFGEKEGQPCFEAIKGRDKPCDSCITVQTFDDKKEHRSEEHGIREDGSPLSHQVTSLPIQAEDGSVDYALLLSLDTTLLRELEQRLQQAEQLATVGLTTAGLAHSIKNILGGLEGGIYVVNSGLEHDNQDRVKDGWNMVQRYIAQVGAMVRNLLRYAKTEEPLRTDVNPAELVNDVVSLFVDKADLVNITIEGQIDDGLTPLSLDRDALRGSLANLVENALDACMWDPDTDKKHQIVVSARQRKKGGVLLEIADNGPGIPKEFQKKVMASSFTTKGMRGTGLGLLLTKKAVEQHQGSITFKTTPGVGTTFLIELPSNTEPPLETN